MYKKNISTHIARKALEATAKNNVLGEEQPPPVSSTEMHLLRQERVHLVSSAPATISHFTHTTMEEAQVVLSKHLPIIPGNPSHNHIN